MNAGGSDDDRPYYGRARIAGGLILIGISSILTVLDAIRTDYSVDSIQLGLLLGTGGVLLGVEPIARFIRGE